MSMNPPRTYSTRLAVIAKRHRLTARASREAQPKVSKPLQEALDALHFDSEADLISCLLGREAFLRISIARRMYTAYTIGLSINKVLKLKKRKGKDM
jgi:hypothetical protein